MQTVADLMTTEVVTVREDTDLSVAWDMFDDLRIRHLPVVDDDDNLIGLLSHRDLARRALGGLEDLPLQEQHAMLAEQQVGEIMARSPESAEPDESLVSVAERMLENKFGCMPICEGNRIVGILTEADFVRLVVLQSDQSA
jgi:CBS domain-containing membrane protein